MPRTATKKRTKVVSYVRMSTSKQDTSPERQRRELKKYCDDHGYTITKEYADLGVSGDNTRKRPQFREMMKLAAEGTITHIVAFDNSRLGRFNSLEAGKWYEPLQESGCVLETIADGVVDFDEWGPRVSQMIKQEADHSVTVATSRAVVSGQTKKAVQANGYPGGPDPYGYRRVAKRVPADTGGTKVIGVLEVVPEQSKIVQRVFELYNQPGGTLRSVAIQLNAEGHLSPAGKVWRKNTISRLLTNRLYRGDYVWGRRQTGRYHTRNGEIGFKKRKKSDGVTYTDPIVHEGVLPRIISEDVWNNTQYLLQRRQKETMTPAVKKTLSGVIFCSDCHKPMRADGDTFRCSASDSDVSGVCPSYRIPASDVLAAICAELGKRFKKKSDREAFKQSLLKAVGARRGDNAAAKELKKRAHELEVEIKTGTGRLTQLSDKLADRLMAHLEGLEAQKEKVDKDLEKLESRSTGAMSSHKRVESLMDNLDELLSQIASGEGDPLVINGLLKAAGVSVKVKPVPAKELKKSRKGWIEVFVPLVLIVATLWPPAAAILRARLAVSCPRTSEKSTVHVSPD